MTLSKNRLSSGLTLIEVMVALFILASLSVGIYWSISEIIRGKEETGHLDQLHHSVGVTFEKMFIDFQGAFILSTPEFLGTEGKVKTVFSGKSEEVHFVTFASFGYFANSKTGGYGEVSYILERDPENPEKKILFRRESESVDQKPEEGGEKEAILGEVKEMEFEYYDPVKKEWLKEWDSTQVEQANRLPRAVKINLKLFPPDGAEVEGGFDYSTAFETALYRGSLTF